MASKNLLLLFAIVLIISSDVASSARTDPAAVVATDTTQGVEVEGWQHKDRHGHRRRRRCHHGHCDEAGGDGHHN